MTEHYIIDKVSWHTMTEGNPETREETLLRFKVLHKYLQEHHLLRPALQNQHQEIDDNFAIHSRDLTEEGLAFMKAAYDKWLGKIDIGMDPRNASVLDRALRAFPD